MKRKPSKFGQKIKVALVLVLLVLLAYLIKLSIDEYSKTAGEVGIVVCNDDECIKTLHIHADIEFDLCGNSPVLPREVGPLSGLHTHKESNYLHFHDKLQLDPVDHVQLYDNRLSLQEVIDVFALDPLEYCNTKEVEVGVMVNGQIPPEGLDYNWVDGDKIEIIYQSK